MNWTLLKAGLSTFSPAGARGKLSILLFHKTPREPDPLTPNELSGNQFEQLLDFISTTCNVLPLHHALGALKCKKLPARAVSLTFDDGYADWLDTLAPALKRRNLHATFFISTEQLGGPPLWHERIIAAVRALPEENSKLPFGFGKYQNLAQFNSRISLIAELQERLKYAPLQERLAAIKLLEEQCCSTLKYPKIFDSSAVRELHSQGFDIGGHTIRHPILNECSRAEAQNEIGGCREELQSIIGGKVELFAYPNGRPLRDYRREHIDIVKFCGYSAAVSTGGGAADFLSDLFQLPRFTPWGTTGPRIAFQLARNMTTPDIRLPESSIAIEGRATENEVKCLLVASTFPPIHGGSAVVYGNLCDEMPSGSIRVLAAKINYLTNSPIDGWQNHDRMAEYPIDRVSLLRPLMLPPPANNLVSLYRLVFQDIPLYGRILLSAAGIVQKHKINVVCIGELVTGSWLGVALRKIFGCKLIIYVHGEEITTATGGRLHGSKRKNYLQLADKVVSVSSFTCDALTNDMGLPSDSIALIQNGVDTDKFTPGPKDENFISSIGLSRKKIILTVGRLVPRKGIDMAIRAMRQVVETFPDAHYVIVGGGEYQSALEQIILAEEMKEHVTLAGMVPDGDLLRYIRACDIFLMPNRTMPDGDTEGFGLVFREANACSKPVIGGNAGGAVEAVIDGETGVLVDGHSIDAIAEAVLNLLTNPLLSEQLGKNGLRVALDNNTKSVANKFLKICDRLLAHK